MRRVGNHNNHDNYSDYDDGRQWQGQQRGNKEDALVLMAEAASALKLKNGNDNGIVMDGSSLEDFVAGFEAG
jgi:hypothetical protein